MRWLPMMAFIAMNISIPNAVHARGIEDGNSLLENCSAAEDRLEYIDCLSYIHGGIDMLVDMQMAKLIDKRVCLPAGVTNGQLKDVVVKYVIEHPEIRHFPAGDLVFLALANNFACSKG